MHIFLRQKASNKKVILKIGVSTGIGKPHEREIAYIRSAIAGRVTQRAEDNIRTGMIVTLFSQ